MHVYVCMHVCSYVHTAPVPRGAAADGLPEVEGADLDEIHIISIIIII